MDAEILVTKKIENSVPSRMMGKIVLTFTVLGKPVKVHIEFKNPVAIDEMPRTVLEAPEENLLEELEAQIWVQTKDQIDMIDEVAGVRENEEDDDEEGEEESE